MTVPAASPGCGSSGAPPATTRWPTPARAWSRSAWRWPRRWGSRPPGRCRAASSPRPSPRSIRHRGGPHPAARAGVYLPPVASRVPAGPVTTRTTWTSGPCCAGAWRSAATATTRCSTPRSRPRASSTSWRTWANAPSTTRRSGADVIRRFGLPTGALTSTDAASIVGAFLRYAGLVADPAVTTWPDLTRLGLPLAEPGRSLRRGEIYALATWVLDLADRRYPPSAARRSTSPPDASPETLLADAPAR
jgi:hypothetical protein